MSILKPEINALVRMPIDNLEESEIPLPRKAINNIVKMVTRDGDVQVVRDAMITRFAQSIEKGRADTGEETTSLVTGKNVALQKAFQGGMYEVSRLYLIDTVGEVNARMHSEGERYEYTKDGVEEQMLEVRARGQANQAMQTADLYSVTCGSSLLYLSTESDQISYDEITADVIHIAYADQIQENEEKRSANKQKIDEATVVVLCLDGSNGRKQKYAAWFGASTQYERGRHCIYWADKWSAIPDVGAGEVTDYTTDGVFRPGASLDEIANPLTAWRLSGKDTQVPEYPFVILKGDPRGRGLLPTTGVSLSEVSLEFDIGSGVTLRAANDSALGQRVVKTEGGQIPDSVTDQVVLLTRGQDFIHTGWSATNAKDALDTIIKQLRTVAEAHHVPGYLIATEYTQYPSGAALRQSQTNMISYRDKRIEYNRASVGRRWQIERALINMSEGGNVVYSSDVKEVWIPGDIQFPADPTEEVAVAKARKELQVDDFVDTFKELHDIETREQVFNMLEQRQEDAERLAAVTPAAPAAQAAPKAGGLGRFQV